MAAVGADACRYGHHYTATNTRHDRDGYRICLACHRRNNREAEARRRAREREKLGRPPRLANRAKAAAVVLCVPEWRWAAQNGDAHRLTRFADSDTARQYAQRLPCPSDRCRGLHVLVVRSGERLAVRSFDQRPRPPLADELAELYPRTTEGLTVWCWPAPLELNEPLTPCGADQ